MAELDVDGAFLITIGGGQGPETNVVVSVSAEDGRPEMLTIPKNPDEGPVSIFIALCAMFGAFDIPLRITAFQPMPLGFYGFRVEAPPDLGVRIEDTVPATLGIVVDTGQDRGQALACSCGGAHVTSWIPEQKQKPDR